MFRKILKTTFPIIIYNKDTLIHPIIQPQISSKKQKDSWNQNRNLFNESNNESNKS